MDLRWESPRYQMKGMIELAKINKNGEFNVCWQLFVSHLCRQQPMWPLLAFHFSNCDLIARRLLPHNRILALLSYVAPSTYFEILI